MLNINEKKAHKTIVLPLAFLRHFRRNQTQFYDHVNFQEITAPWETITSQEKKVIRKSF